MEVDGVEEEEVLHRWAEAIDCIKDCREIGEQLCEDTPQILHVPEKDKQGRKNQPHPNVKKHQRKDGDQQQHKLPRECNIVDDTEHKEHDEHKAEIDERLHIFGKQEQILRNVYFCENSRVSYQRGHALAGGLAEIRKDQVAAEQIGGVVLHGAPEKLGKHHAHDKQLEKRRKNTPRHAEHGTFVFFLEVSFDELFEEELRGFKPLKHKNTPKTENNIIIIDPINLKTQNRPFNKKIFTTKIESNFLFYNKILNYK